MYFQIFAVENLHRNYLPSKKEHKTLALLEAWLIITLDEFIWALAPATLSMAHHNVGRIYLGFGSSHSNRPKYVIHYVLFAHPF